jgi:hypothetical protein
MCKANANRFSVASTLARWLCRARICVRDCTPLVLRTLNVSFAICPRARTLIGACQRNARAAPHIRTECAVQTRSSDSGASPIACRVGRAPPARPARYRRGIPRSPDASQACGRTGSAPPPRGPPRRAASAKSAMAYVMFCPTRWSGRLWPQRRRAATRRSRVCTDSLQQRSPRLRIRKIAPSGEWATVWRIGLTQPIKPPDCYGFAKIRIYAYKDALPLEPGRPAKCRPPL